MASASGAASANPYLASQGGTNPFMSGSSSGSSAALSSSPNPFLKSSGGSNPFMSNSTSTSQNPFSNDVQSPTLAPATQTVGSLLSGAQNASAPTSVPGLSAPSQTGVGSAVGSLWNHTLGPVYNDLKGGLQGYQSTKGVPWMGLFQGLAHPGQAHQQYQQYMGNLDSQIHNPVEKWVTNTLHDTAGDPASYLPFGKIVEAAHIPQGLKLLKGLAAQGIEKSPTLTKAANATKNNVAAIFKTLPGTRDYFKQGVSEMYGSRASGANTINKKLQEIFKGTTPEQRITLTHALESTAPGTKLSDPILEGLRQKVEPLLTKAEQTARSKGLLDKSLDLNAMGVKRYLPHIHVDKFDTAGNPITQGRLLKASIDANKTRSIKGTIQNINATSKTKFESDALKVLAHHLHGLNNAVTAKDLINQALTHGLEPGAEHGLTVGDLHPQTGTPLQEYTHDGKTTLLPEDEKDYLTGMSGPRTKAEQRLQNYGNLYRKVVNLSNQAMFLHNPLIHIGPNLGWQTLVHDPGAFPSIIKNIPEALRGVKPGSQMDQALQHGALNLGSEIGTKGSTAKRVSDLVKSVDHPTNPLVKLLSQYTHLTPNLEKAYRTGMYGRQLEKGATPWEASNFVRSIYGGHIAPNTASLAEKSARSVMPFINWTKTAMVSNAKNAMNRPAIYDALYHGMNDLNSQVTGHDMGQNPNPTAVGIPEQNANGWQKYAVPYFPAMDIAKLGKDIGTNGAINGVADFGFNRSNPIVKFITQKLTSEQNPFAQPINKFPVDQYEGNPLIPKSEHTGAWGKQFLQDFSLQGIQPPQTNVTPLDRALNALGTYTYAPNPFGKAKEQSYNTKNWRSQFRSYERKQAQGGQ